MSWWTWLILAVFVILAVYFFWPRRNQANNDTESTRIQPRFSFNGIYVWAAIGVVFLLFSLYVWIKWITGSYFERVPSGVSEPPMWMQVCLITLTSLFWIVLPLCIYYLIIRPWRRERRITTDGIFLVVFGLMSFQDPLLNYLNCWCTYNSWLFNMGNWVQDIPGWLSFGEPGAMFAEPILVIFPGYAVGIFLCTILGCWIMRRAHRIWPNIGILGMFGVAIVFAFFWDILMEGMFFMRMGFYTYPGAIRSLCVFPGHYYQYPVYEGVFWGLVQAFICMLRYYKDDHGRTFVERGLERIQGGLVKQQMLRFLAIYAACSIFFLVFYNIPAQWLAMHADAWPEDIQKRSYFMNGMFGEDTGRLCPDPSLPNPVNDQAYVGFDEEGNYVLIFPDGTELVLPEGYDFPEVIPFESSED